MVVADAMEGLHLVNQRLQALLARMQPGGNPADIVPQELADLLNDLTLAADWLRAGVASGDVELKKEICDYRSSLQRLQSLLPSLQARLLTERARLDAERSHLHAASAWSKASKDTL
ncbi:MAG: hypothetical protein LAN63_11705 [Acidobacteriia bacterium]|nr:hypothetical protein [Terriglobia bacterium]